MFILIPGCFHAEALIGKVEGLTEKVICARMDRTRLIVATNSGTVYILDFSGHAGEFAPYVPLTATGAHWVTKRLDNPIASPREIVRSMINFAAAAIASFLLMVSHFC